MTDETTSLKTAASASRLREQLLPYLIAVAFAFAASGALIGAMGFDVPRAFATILFTSFRSPNGFAQTLTKFVPLLLQALAFTIPLAAGKFNIGGEGQLIVGGIAAAAVGIMFPGLPGLILLPLALLAGMIAGALWILVPAWLLYRFQINEILTTVLMNFVAFEVINFVSTEVWPDPAAGHPTTVPIGAGAHLPMLLRNPPLHSGLLLAVLIAAGAYFYTQRTSSGYELIVTGANPRAARVHGVNVRMLFFASLLAGGVLAGLSGAVEVTGNYHRLIEGLQSNFLLLGIIIGLIARGNHLAVPFVAFFIAVLDVGASALQRTLAIPSEMVFIVMGLILIFVLLSDVIQRRR
ncbi:MAG: ABC transporter permease [Anaerolineales bacterium]|nr:ABC transporter permease [Anaerolineales bacterium]